MVNVNGKKKVEYAIICLYKVKSIENSSITYTKILTAVICVDPDCQNFLFCVFFFSVFFFSIMSVM